MAKLILVFYTRHYCLSTKVGEFSVGNSETRMAASKQLIIVLVKRTFYLLFTKKIFPFNSIS